eukprot:1475106-Rhodomonas_salina.3
MSGMGYSCDVWYGYKLCYVRYYTCDIWYGIFTHAMPGTGCDARRVHIYVNSSIFLCDARHWDRLYWFSSMPGGTCIGALYAMSGTEIRVGYAIDGTERLAT